MEPFVLTHGLIQVANSKVFCKLGNGTVRDLTLDTNTIYNHPSAIQCNAATEIENLKSSVSNGKNLIANAITDKGVATSSSDTFATMANNIESLNILNPIYQDVIDNTDILSECTGPSYYTSYRSAKLISGPSSFKINNDTFILYTNNDGPSGTNICWREDTYSSPANIVISVDSTSYGYLTNTAIITLRGGVQSTTYWDRAYFTGNAISYADGVVTIQFSEVTLVNRDNDFFSGEYYGRVSTYVDNYYEVNAEVYGNREQIADWRDFNPSVTIRIY